MNPEKRMRRRTGWLVLILLAAVFLRMYDVSGVPPGLTHDEADHGITARQVINGERAVYFTVGYGREPLYDYSTALLMSFIGPSYLAGRLTAVFYSLILIASTFAWVRRAFNERIALLTVAGIAVSFWAVMTARQSLRSVALPALFVPALYLFWRGMDGSSKTRSALRYVLPAGTLLGLTFYTYIPARILWLLFPLAAATRPLPKRAPGHRVWQTTALVLLIAAIAGSPLFLYLVRNPEAESRIKQLSDPLVAAAQGDLETLLNNASDSLSLFTFSGDPSWRYNIAGRPLLQPVMGALFYLGLGVSIWHLLSPAKRHRRAAHAASLAWLGLGMAPVLVTGPELSMTQAIGMQPVLYLFPALGVCALGEWDVLGRRLFSNANASKILLVLLFAGTGISSGVDYFNHWGRAPEVRVQYESTMVAAMRYLKEAGADAAAVSTITPNPLHTPAVAQMVIPEEAADIRWFDGRHSLALPRNRQGYILFPGFAPLAPELERYFESAVLTATVPQPASDLDRPLSVYHVDGIALAEEWQRRFAVELPGMKVPVNLGDSLEFLGYQLGATEAVPGDTVAVVTLWRVLNPMDDPMLFTHLQGEDGIPVAQADRLDVPGSSWKRGDLFIQLHQLQIARELPAGDYPMVAGLCQGTLPDCSRLPIVGQESSGDLFRLTTLSILP